MKRTTRQLMTVTMLAMLAAPLSQLCADEVRIGKIWYKDVRIVGLHQGKLYYQTQAGEQSVELSRVSGLRLGRYPQLAKVDAALDNQRYAVAADMLTDLLPKVQEEYARIILGAKLVAALDRAGRFDRAAVEYLKLMRLHRGPLLEAAKPRNFPKDPAERKRLARFLEQRKAVAGSNEAMAFLNETIKQLEADPDSPDAQPVPDPGATQAGALLGGSQEAIKDPVEELIRAERYRAALKYITEDLKHPRVMLTKRLYQRGVCQAALGQDNDALISFMRVLIHFRPQTTDRYLPALVNAARLFIRQNKPDHARALLKEAAGLAQPGSPPAQEIQKMLGAL